MTIAYRPRKSISRLSFFEACARAFFKARAKAYFKDFSLASDVNMNNVRARFLSSPMILFVMLSVGVMMTSSCRRHIRQNGDRFETNEVAFTLEAPTTWSDGWRKEGQSKNHVAWINPNGDAVIVHYLCEDGLSTPLDALLRHLHIGIDDIDIRTLETIDHSSREALVEHATGKVDGVLRDFNFMVLAKDECVYDIMVTGSPEDEARLDELFARLIGGFKVLSRPNWNRRVN